MFLTSPKQLTDEVGLTEYPRVSIGVKNSWIWRSLFVMHSFLMFVIDVFPAAEWTLRIKLLKSGFDGTKSIIIYGYDYENFPLLKTIELYEKIAKEFYSISERYSSSFENLVHPVHQKGNVFGWIIDKK